MSGPVLRWPHPQSPNAERHITDWKIEVVAVPVTDIDRARDFYVRIGFVLDMDQIVSNDIRFVQLTPPGSACAISLGRGLTAMAPGSLDNIQVVVADADAEFA